MNRIKLPVMVHCCWPLFNVVGG